MQGAEVDALFKAARKLHEQGRLAEAERLYLAVLKVRSRHYDSLQFAGLAALQTDQIDLAIERLEAAISIQPKSVSARVKLCQALQKIGRLHEALAQYDVLIALDSAAAVHRTNRGRILHRLSHLVDAQ